MELLHETMIVQDTPLSTEEIRQYIAVQKVLLVGNIDFDKHIKKHDINVDWYIESEEYRVVEINQ